MAALYGTSRWLWFQREDGEQHDVELESTIRGALQIRKIFPSAT